MKIHLIGICGSGMAALAGLLQSMGHTISGSDVRFDPPMGPILKKKEILLFEGFCESHLKHVPDLVIVGNVCRSSNPEAEAALSKGFTCMSMPKALATFVLDSFSPLVVAGTHGKTTTTSMCAHILEESGKNPGYLMGGIPKNLPSNYAFPVLHERRTRELSMITQQNRRRTPFVIEGDEYDTAFFDKTPKFWHYLPEVGIVTSIEHDHVDIYPDEKSYGSAFEGFISRIPESGLLVACASEPSVVQMVTKSANCQVMCYALEGDETYGQPPHFSAGVGLVSEQGQMFDLFVGGVFAAKGFLPTVGRHNLRNALAAIAACVQGYGVSVLTAITALSKFEGVRRRQDLIFQKDGITIYDDFAHHPTAVHETLKALRSKHPHGRLWAVYEPRSATACRNQHEMEYVQSFQVADRVLLAPLGRSLDPAEQLDLNRVVSELNLNGKWANKMNSVDEMIAFLKEQLLFGDVVVLMSNGFFGGIVEKLPRALTLS